MSDDEPAGAPPLWRRNEPDSPCVAVCAIHPSAKICIGCGRRADEIADWAQMTPEERAEIRRVLPTRFDALRDAANRPSRRRRARADGEGLPEP